MSLSICSILRHQILWQNGLQGDLGEELSVAGNTAGVQVTLAYLPLCELSSFPKNLIGLASLSPTGASVFSPRQSYCCTVSSRLKFVCFSHTGSRQNLWCFKGNCGPGRLLEFHQFSLKIGVFGHKEYTAGFLSISGRRGMLPSNVLVIAVSH